MPTKTAKANQITPEAADRVPRSRSPNYPVFGLQKAVERAKTLHDTYKAYPVSVSQISPKWGYKAGSSNAAQCIGALRAYGLVETTGTGDDRKVKASERAVKILMNHRDREALLKESALSPSIFRELWQRFHQPDVGLAPDGAIKHYLLFDRTGGTFNAKMIDGVIADFKSTVQFAQLSGADTLPEASDEDTEDMDDENQTGQTGVLDVQGSLKARTSVKPMEERWNLHSGPVVFTAPPNLTAEDLDVFDAYMTAWMLRAKAAAKKAAQ